MDLSSTSILRALGAALLAAAFHHYTAFNPQLGEGREIAVMDDWFKRRGEIPAPEDIVLVRIDEDTYKAFGLSLLEAFPREKLADIICKIANLGAKGLALDIVIREKTPKDAADIALAEALQMLPSVVGSWDFVQTAGPGQFRRVTTTSDPFFLRPGVMMADLTLPLDQYQITRSFYPPNTSNGPKPLPLALVAATLLGRPAAIPGPRDFINFYGLPGSIHSISAYKLLGQPGAMPLPSLSGKLVFVGFTITGSSSTEMKDAKLTPFGLPTFGVEIHATAAANILRQDWITRLSHWKEESIWALAIFLSTLALCLLDFKKSALVLLCLVIFRLYGAYVLFKWGLFTPGLYATRYILPFAFGFGWFWNYVAAIKKQTVLRECLSRYVNPEMTRLLETKPELRKPMVEQRQVAVLFSDMRRYTRLSECAHEGRTGELLNRYLPVISEHAMKHGGTVLKSAGDGALVIWGTPIPMNQPCELALGSAAEIDAVLAREIRAGRLPAYTTKFGLSYGPADVGNVGSLERFDYSAEGDTLNVASRLVGVASKLGLSIVLSQRFAEELKDHNGLFELGAVRVKGRRAPVGVYTFLLPEVSPEAAELWKRALKAFQARSFMEAHALFWRVSGLEKRLKKAARVYCAQAWRYQKRTPYANWNGELILRSK